MHEHAEQFSQYCESTLDLTNQFEYNYQSLSVCILDCVYSLRTKYYTVTVPIVERYASAFMRGDSQGAGDTVSMLMQRMDEVGHKEFADTILRNQQKLGGKKQLPKEEVFF